MKISFNKKNQFTYTRGKLRVNVISYYCDNKNLALEHEGEIEFDNPSQMYQFKEMIEFALEHYKPVFENDEIIKSVSNHRKTYVRNGLNYEEIEVGKCVKTAKK